MESTQEANLMDAVVPDLEGFRARLRDWFSRHARPLPWRWQKSIYATVVSELMLQQTQVDTALPYYRRWMVQFPDFSSLASAPEDAVLKAWEGLGYYARARNLQALARRWLVADPKPSTSEEWLAYPGVGAYTASAIASLGFGQAVAVVDGNVVRVITRLTADAREFPDPSTAARLLKVTATRLLDPLHPGTHNEAMMELGATVCLRRRPLCLLCPVRSHCAAGRSSHPEDFPRILRQKPLPRTVDRAWVERDGSLLLELRPARGRLAGLHELPTLERVILFRPEYELLGSFKRAIGRERITETIHRVPLSPALSERVGADSGLVWVDFDHLESLTLSGPHKRWISRLRRKGTVARRHEDTLLRTPGVENR